MCVFLIVTQYIRLNQKQSCTNLEVATIPGLSVNLVKPLFKTLLWRQISITRSKFNRTSFSEKSVPYFTDRGLPFVHFLTFDLHNHTCNMSALADPMYLGFDFSTQQVSFKQRHYLIHTCVF